MTTGRQQPVWAEERLDGLRLLRGRAAGLEVALLPEVGGKGVAPVADRTAGR